MLVTHAQIRVDGIEVDEAIAPLLQQIWRRGLTTQWSCQGTWAGPEYSLGNGTKGYPDDSYDPWWPGEEDVENSTYVAFDSLDDAFTFLHETAEMLVSAVGPSDLVLRDAELALEPFEPDEQGVGLLRGCVRFHPALLQTITNLWGSPLNEL
jgi:hypothetical protein